jgi:heptosyltransferase-2
MKKPDTPRRIIVRTPNWVGDAVMSLPFLNSLRLNSPDAEISLLTRPGLADFFKPVIAADRVIALEETAGRHGLRMVWKNAKSLRQERYELGFCLPPSFGSALMFKLAGVTRTVGHAADRRSWLLSGSLPYLPKGRRPHRAEGYLQLLGLVWDNPKIDKSLRYDPGEDARSLAKSLLREKGISDTSKMLVVAPGAAQPNKMWAPDRFSEVCDRWLRLQGAVVAVVGGTGDRDVAGRIRSADSARLFNLCGVGSLPLVAAIIEYARIFVGNDSGLSHLAAATGAPVVVISGPGDPSEVSPFTDRAITVKKSLYCSPCYSNTCFRKDHPLECQELVSVDDVWGAVNRL